MRWLPNLTILHRGAKLFNAMDWLFALGLGRDGLTPAAVRFMQEQWPRFMRELQIR
jgi:hypothetical protein